MRAVLFYRCWIGPKYEARGCLLRSCFFLLWRNRLQLKLFRISIKCDPHASSASLFWSHLTFSISISFSLSLSFALYLSLLSFHCIWQCATVYWAYVLSLIHTHLGDKHKHSLQCFSFGFIAQNLFALHWRGIVITYR